MFRAPAVWLLSTVVGLAALAPTASAAQINPAVQLAALSCASTGNCGAVGNYDDGLGDGQGLLVNESGGSWHPGVQARAPAGAATDPFKLADGGGLADISCPVAGGCAAIGRYTDAHQVDHGVAFAESHGRWGRGTALQLPANAAPTPRRTSGVVDPLALTSISCGSAGNCVAVGSYETNALVWEAMIIVERGGHWARAIEAPLPAGAPIEGQNAVLISITCARSGSCSASGEYVDGSGHQLGLLVSGHGSSWTVASAPAPPSDANLDPNMTPSSIACADAADCAAVGTYINPLRNSLGLLLDESAGQWRPGAGATLPADAAPATTVGDQTVVLSSVACPQVGGCTAVGWYFDNYENGEGLLVSQSGGSWQPGVRVQLPANAVGGLEKQSAGLGWISCSSPGNCLATGVYTDIGYNSQGLLLSESGGIWQGGLESPLPRNASRVQYAAANQSDCTAAGDCTVIGQYNVGRGNVLGYVLSETGGIWGKASEVMLPAPTAAEARLSLAAILTPAGRAARLAQLRRSHRYVYDYQAVEAGTATTRWYAAEAGARRLIGSGQVYVPRAGSFKLDLQLTPAGAQLLAGAKRLHVSVTASFTPVARQPSQRVRASFTLH